MGNRHIFGVRAGVTAISTELAWSEGCHKCSCAVQAAVAIRGIACDQFVWIATEVNAGFSDQIEECKLIVLSICQCIS